MPVWNITKKMPNSAMSSMEGEFSIIPNMGGPNSTPARSSPNKTGKPKREKMYPNTHDTVRMRRRLRISSEDMNKASLQAINILVFLFIKLIHLSGDNI
jgi:hypothetical protein